MHKLRQDHFRISQYVRYVIGASRSPWKKTLGMGTTATFFALASFSPFPAKAILGGIGHFISSGTKTITRTVGTVASGAGKTTVEVTKILVSPVAPVAKAVASVMITPVVVPVRVIGVIAGGGSLSNAGKKLVAGAAAPISSVGEAVAATNTSYHDAAIVAATHIAGNVGKTIVTIGTGPEAIEVDFASAAAIESSEVLQGARITDLEAYPLAAAMYSSELQFQHQSKPIPQDVVEEMRDTGAYDESVLQNARYAIGNISITIPSIVETSQHYLFKSDYYAVTVGNISVFSHDPGSNYHWWAHELWHQVQYSENGGGLPGIYAFARRYVTDCFDVENEAESTAEKYFSIGVSVIKC